MILLSLTSFALTSPALAAPPQRTLPPRARAPLPAELARVEGRLARQLQTPALRSPDQGERPQVVLELADPSTASTMNTVLSAVPGLTIEVTAGALVQVRLPWASIPRVAELDGVRRVRAPTRARAKEVTSEGIDDLFAQDWEALGLTGAGVTIAVLDVGFYGYEDHLGDELPDSVDTHFLGGWRGSDHGTDVAQILHDIAPDAELVLYSFDTDVEFLAHVYDIADSSAHLVNASIGFDNRWHADGTSAWSQGVDLVHEAGIAWFAAAGNESDNYWVGTVTDDDNDGWLEFGDEGELLLVETDWSDDAEVELSFRWDEPFGGASSDLDLFIDSVDYVSGDEPCGSSEDEQDGDDDPYEYTWCELGDGSDYAYASVFVYDGRGDGRTGWLYSYHNVPEESRTYTQNLTLPADAAGGIAVGAVDWEYDEVVDYSSRGPTDDGRNKPDLSAPTIVSTTNGWFTGTSAAAPHVTGVAALALQASVFTMDPEDLRAWLTSETVDLGDPGYDLTYGHGYLRVDDPPEEQVDPKDTGPEDTGPEDTGADTALDTDDTDGLSDAGPAPDDTADPDTDAVLDEGPPKNPYEAICACSTGVAGPGAAWMLITVLLGFTRRREP